MLLRLVHLEVILTKPKYNMSALESPPTLTPAWQDPWGMAMAGTVSPADFYDQNKAGQMTQAFYPHQPMVHGYPHHPMMDGQNNNNNSMNSGSEGSTGSAVSSTNVPTSKSKPQRQVNFKLDIKAEPQESQLHPQVSGGMQKVPSISDLSDPDSSLDIPCSQVRPNSNCRDKVVDFSMFELFLGSAINSQFKQKSWRSFENHLRHLGERF